ncbi:MAG: DUF4160 domain-containing protein [Saprospiraceae bacterium]|nr:DUF4160 domain-containing protein [Saprospiraceae bacterium]
MYQTEHVSRAGKINHDYFLCRFHVEYSEYDAMIEIESGDILRGSLPAKQLKYIQVWSDIHKAELLENFISMRSDSKLYKKITPLS